MSGVNSELQPPGEDAEPAAITPYGSDAMIDNSNPVPPQDTDGLACVLSPESGDIDDEHLPLQVWGTPEATFRDMPNLG